MAQPHEPAPAVKRLTSAAATTPPSVRRAPWRTSALTPPVHAASSAVVTVLSPNERLRVDAAGEGCYHTLHRNSVEEALQDLRDQRADAVLVSVGYFAEREMSAVGRLVREFPRVPAVALLSQADAQSARAVFTFGQCGVPTLVDVRDPKGWQELRHALTTQQHARIEQQALHRVVSLLPGAPEDCLRFFEACFTAPARVSTVRRLARRLGVLPSTFMSRFFRAQLPAPKQYLMHARLVRAASCFENPGLSVSQVAHLLEYSSPQSFSRHIQHVLGVTAVHFRCEFPASRMLELFLEQLVVPHSAVLRQFHPLLVLPAWTRERASGA